MKSLKTLSVLRRCLRVLPALLLLIPFASTEKSPASFSSKAVRAHVEIEGVDYGAFDQIDGLASALQDAMVASSAIENADSDNSDATVAMLRHRKITLQRDFVTNPSLYLWAKTVMEERSGLKDVSLVFENRDGDEISRYVLKLCQPLSWSLEAANPALGGFHEKVDLAVQGVSIQ